jgi:galactose mutarotase-like enzyme
MEPAVRLTTWQGEPAVELRAGALATTFLPTVSMLGVSVTHDGEELLAPLTSLAQYRAGHTTGIPLLHAWANRLGAWSYRAAGRRVEVPRDVPVDPNGLPIHGTLFGLPFDVVHIGTTKAGAAVLDARIDAARQPRLFDAFPFPHLLDVRVAVTPDMITITNTLQPTGERGRNPDQGVPVSFGWHPYFRLPGAPRAQWRLRLPARRHAALDAQQLPTGVTTPEPAEDAQIAGRTFDDHYALGRDRRFELIGGGRRLGLRFGSGYPFAQVFVPPNKDFAAIEPMTAAVNALVAGTAPVVMPGSTFRASWQIGVEPA